MKTPIPSYAGENRVGRSSVPGSCTSMCLHPTEIKRIAIYGIPKRKKRIDDI